MAELVPRRIGDPFVAAIDKVRELEEISRARRNPPASTIYFGAPRREGRSRHNGIDLVVPVGTRIRLPAEKAVLIGFCKDSATGAGASIGNGIVLFVPDKEQPHFLLLAHLSARTFRHLKDSGYRIGSEISAGTGGAIIAYAGASKAGPVPHVHVSATTTLMLGGKIYRAEDFQEMLKAGTLQNRNFFSVMPATRYKNPRSLEGYLNPLALIDNGKLRFSSLPGPPRVAQEMEKRPPSLISLR